MSSRLTLPLSQQRHSNVAVVKLQRNGKRLEIACYKNKVVAYRSGVERRLDEVLQVERVFLNVSRGECASIADIHAVLGDTYDEKAALKFILDNGDLQVAQQERSAELTKMMRDVCTTVASTCVHPATNRPYPVTMIEQAAHSLGLSVRLDSTSKKQALVFTRKLIESQVIPIRRAHMQLRCIFPTSISAEQVSAIQRLVVSSSEAKEGGFAMDCVMDPENFRSLDTLVQQTGGVLRVIEMALVETTEGAARDIEAMTQLAKNTPPPEGALQVRPAIFDMPKAARMEKKLKTCEPVEPSDALAKPSEEDEQHSDSDNELTRKKGVRRNRVERRTQKKLQKESDPPPPVDDEDDMGNRKERKKKNVQPVRDEKIDDEVEEGEEQES